MLQSTSKYQLRLVESHSDINVLQRYKQLSTEEAMVFSHIESAGREGIWARTCRSRTNLHPTTLNRCLKSLESKAMVKQFVSSKNANRKMYILANLQPSEDVTGGPFFTDGKLDEEFVYVLGRWIEKYIASRSWRHHSYKGNDGERTKNKKLLPMPPGFTGYPTLPEITRAMNDSRITSGVVLKEAEMKQLVDLLRWDGHIIEVMNGRGYKSVRASFTEDEDFFTGNGLTEAPCGECPVFDLCEEGGPVNARSCTYFVDWLDTL